MSNTTTYDPGQFRHKVLFTERQVSSDNSGGQDVQNVPVLETFAVREKIREGATLAVTAGLTNLNRDFVFVIRHRIAFYPRVDMTVTAANETYTIVGVYEINEPVTYLKVVCKRVV
jgi:SPP1 family predicted phage head-tail adaptor